MRPELVVALDLPSAGKALELARSLMPVTPWMKVGLELFTAAGPAMVRDLKNTGCSVFLDLKFHDIPNTVAGAVRSAVFSGADICDIHVSGEAMCRAAAEAKNEAVRACGAGDCLLLGVTVLTSEPERNFGRDAASLVVEKAKSAMVWGLDGVVCSGQEAAAVKKACGKEFVCLCPGIRMPEADGNDDQSRVMTPAEAVRQGADFLVVGRPITRAADPLKAALAVKKNMC